MGEARRRAKSLSRKERRLSMDALQIATDNTRIFNSHHPNMSLVAVGVFQFAEATVRVSESSSEAEITIENTGDSSVSARLRKYSEC
ncbi:hypothetical protein P5673_009380 [Acropora cervicornis]|uniref:Uncharacterized protein n=1 Tax=Acropora cervicornis TaxID=6130 RepID=A0AAD9QSR6_ACRCE|nr:hypothetical protein P5673_009380 [Acropora cervicornis]